MTGYSSTVLADSPVVYLDMQETSGTTATDSSGNSHNASYVNGAVVNDSTDTAAPTALGKHVYLDGANDHVLLDASTTWMTPATAGFTFEGWFYIRSWTNWQRIFDFANAGSTDDMFFAANNAGSMTLKIAGGSFACARFTTGVWTHVVVTVSTAGAATIYCNGSVYATGAVGSPTNGTRAFKYVGRSSYADPYLNASVTQVAVYNGVLTSTQVANHYSAGVNNGNAQASGSGTLSARARANPPSSYSGYPIQDGAVAYYRLDEGSGTTMTDSSGNSHGGTYNNGATPTATGLLASDPNDKALTLDGVDDYASVPYASWMTPTTAFSCDFWYVPTSVAGNRYILGRSDNSGPYSNIYSWLFFQSGNQLQFQVFTGNSATVVTVTAPAALVAGTTYHVAVTYDGTTVQLYVNGAQVATVAASGSMNTAPNIDLTIGACHNNSVAQRLAGTIDEVAIYHSVLTANQIADHYLVGSTAGATVVTDTGAFSGSGTLSASAVMIKSGTGAFSGSGTLSTATEQYLQSATGALSGSGALSASTIGEGGIQTATGALSGSGTLGANVLLIQTATGAFSGSGTLAAATMVVQGTTPALSGSGALSAVTSIPDGPVTIVATADFGSEGTLSVDVVSAVQPGVDVRRWAFFDPDNGDFWIVPINPNKMTSPFVARNIVMAHGTHAGPQRIRAIDQPAAGPATWTFSGVIRAQSHHDTLKMWAEKNKVVRITDHLERTFEVIIASFNPTDRRPKPGLPWLGNFEMNCLVLREIKRS